MAGEESINFGSTASETFIKPAKFVYNERNRVAQSSWVAGGYWHNGTSTATLSRSSSQSSGIGSLTSANGLLPPKFVSSLPNSRVNSTCGGAAELERFSIFSEPAYNSSFLNSTMMRKKDNDNDSLNSSFGRLSQEAFAKLKPKAESSPLLSESSKATDDDVSFLERKITINISMYSLLLILSVGVNISLSVYLMSSFLS